MDQDVFRDGVLLRREALTLGIDDKSLHRAVKAKTLERIRQGAYASRSSWLELSAEDRHRRLITAVARMYGDGVVVSHASGVIELGGPGWGLDLANVDITHPGGNGRVQGSVRHHFGNHRADDIVRPDGLRVTSVARTVVQATMRSRSAEVGTVLASHFLSTGATTMDDLATARSDMGTAPGSLLVRTALAHAHPKLHSVAESRCWFILNRSSLPQVIPQYPLFDGSGPPWAFLDFAIPELGVFVEMDGNEKYYRFRRVGESMEDFLLRERRRENRACEETGWSVVRLVWRDLDDPDQLIERIMYVARRRRP